MIEERLRKTLLLSLLLVFTLHACSLEGTHRSDREGDPQRSTPVAGEAPSPGFGEEETMKETKGYIAIERTILSSAGESHVIHAMVDYGGSWVWPRCYLLEGPSVDAVRRTIKRQNVPMTAGFTRVLWTESLWADRESLWADRRTTEKVLTDNGMVIWKFYEDPARDDEAAYPRRTPFFVRCVGGDHPDIVYDVAHVVGTPGSGNPASAS
jgi:hypothetical protein